MSVGTLDGSTVVKVDKDGAGGHTPLAELWANGAPVATGNPLPVSGGAVTPTNITLLASAPRTAAVQSAAQVNNGYTKVVIYLVVTAASGTGGLTAQFQLQDPLSGNWYADFIATTAVTATGGYIYGIGPGVSQTGQTVKQVFQFAVPVNWRIVVNVGDSSSYTYSVSADLLP